MKGGKECLYLLSAYPYLYDTHIIFTHTYTNIHDDLPHVHKGPNSNNIESCVCMYPIYENVRCAY